MKKIYISFLLVLSVFIVQAQEKKKSQLEIADDLFDKYEFVQAAKEYQRLVRGVKTDNYINLQLAECYYNIFNTVEAAKFYAKAIEKDPKQDIEVYYKYYQMLKASGRYDTANDVMRKFGKMAPDDQRSIEFYKDPDYIPRLRSQEELFTFEDSGLNLRTSSDFSAFVTTNDTVYFATTRSGKKKVYGWNDQPYLDLFQATYDPASGKVSKIRPVREINTEYHDGPATVTEDGKTMYFATESFREGNYVKNKKKNLRVGKVSLFKATKKGNRWGDIEPLPFNGKDYFTSNPSISRDGKTLYFASDMPGTIGGMDIWKVSIDVDKETNEVIYGEPQNLGSKVNTEGRESFPFIASDNKLYFSSDSRKGFGGLDVYVLDLEVKGSAAKNLGTPINTAKDDFGFSLYPEKKFGYFSTNRVGRDDIYKAIPICNAEIYVTVINESTGKTIEGARVTILDDKKNVIETRYSDSRGIVEYVVDCGIKFVLQVAKENFESKIIELPAHKGGREQVTASLRPIEVIIVQEQIILGDVFFEFNKANITQQGAFELDKLVQIMERNLNLKIRVESHTDSRGSDQYNLKLSEGRANSTVQYLLSKGITRDRLEAVGYGESRPKINCGDNCTEAEHAHNRRSEFIIIQK